MSGTSWEEMYAELQAFKAKYGHCNVSTMAADYKKLGIWVANQRQSKKKGKLAQSRLKFLEEIGFQWELRHTRNRAPRRSWEAMFARLAQFQREYGTCNVPYSWEDDPALGRWVQKQRYARETGSLSQEQIGRLDVLGFE
jgi:hypothetical protein